jgi:hypothetical protein
MTEGRRPQLAQSGHGATNLMLNSLRFTIVVAPAQSSVRGRPGHAEEDLANQALLAKKAND